MIDSDGDLALMDTGQLRGEVRKLRGAVRVHRDQRGDDRCWVDDVALYALLPEKKAVITELPGKEAFLAQCEQYWGARQCPYRRAAPPREVPPAQDDDLDGLGIEGLLQETLKLRTGIRVHRERADRRTWEDDFRLYMLLPEPLGVDTTLPPHDTFLGNCARFWQTRQGQHPQKLHEW